jgi:flagellum-specific peptidoglycan hydrolase FlgJ
MPRTRQLNEYWLESLVPSAQQAKREWPGMRVACCLAQAAVESGWGEQVIGGFNLWGIKQLTWVPGVVEVDTHEWEENKLVARKARFAAFLSLNEAMGCYGRLVTNSQSYAAARAESSLDEYTAALCKVWATDPMYRKKVWAIVTVYNLEGLDDTG